MDNFLVVPIELARDERLSVTQLRVLLVLFSFRLRSTDICSPAVNDVSDKTRLDAGLVRSVMDELVGLGWISSETGVVTIPEQFTVS